MTDHFAIFARGSMICLAGEIDIAAAAPLRTAAIGALEQAGGDELILKLSRVTFLDSTGIGALVAIRNAASAKQRGVRIVDPSPAARRVLELTALAAVFGLPEPIRAGGSPGA